EQPVGRDRGFVQFARQPDVSDQRQFGLLLRRRVLLGRFLVVGLGRLGVVGGGRGEQQPREESGQPPSKQVGSSRTDRPNPPGPSGRGKGEPALAAPPVGEGLGRGSSDHYSYPIQLVFRNFTRNAIPPRRPGKPGRPGGGGKLMRAWTRRAALGVMGLTLL